MIPKDEKEALEFLKKPLPYGSSPFSFFAANYCTYLFSSAFTIFWNSSFASSSHPKITP